MTTTVVRPDVCPNPATHRMWDAGSEDTIRRRAEHRLIPAAPGRCGYCGGAVPTDVEPGRVAA